MNETGLVRYDAMCHAIAEAHEVDEVSDIRNKAMALEHYAQQAMNMEAERKACDIRLRAERRAGELLAEKERDPISKGGKRSAIHAEPPKSEYAQAKESAGISDTQAQRWQKLATVPEDEFEAALADPEKKPSTSGILARNGESHKMDPDALWLWGRLRDFEKRNLFQSDCAQLLGEMTETMFADVVRIAPLLRSFLQQLEAETNEHNK